VLLAAHVPEHVLGEAQIDRVDSRQEYGVAFGVLSAMRAEIVVVLNQLVECRRLLRRT
jgi:hypothetical protein